MEFTDKQIKELVYNACNGDMDAFAILLESRNQGNNYGWTNFHTFLDTYLKKLKFNKIKDDDMRDECIDIVIQKLLTTSFDFSKRVLPYIAKTYENVINSYLTSNKNNFTILVDTSQNPIISETIPPNELYPKPILNTLNSVSDLHFAMFGNLSLAKYDLYLNGIDINYNDEILFQNLSDFVSKPMLYGNFKNSRSISSHNLKHQLWRNFNYNDRYFMEAAIEQMQLSKTQNRPTKPDPIVGGVLVDEFGNIVAYSHRGEFGKEDASEKEYRMLGDHCEFNLLTKKIQNIDLSRCKLFVTLEPCSKRGPSKTPCANRVIESGIKQVCIGMLDPDKEIYDNGIQLLEKAGIEVTFFHDDLTEKIKNHPSMIEFIDSRNKT